MIGAESLNGVVAHVPLTVALYATLVKQGVAFQDNDEAGELLYSLRMPQRSKPKAQEPPVTIHQGKTPQRVHFIPEWAERRQKIQADFVRELGVNKSTVSHWFDGMVPREDNLLRVAAFLHLNEDPGALFRHPDDDWLARFLRGRNAEEKERIRAVLEAAFSHRTGTEG